MVSKTEGKILRQQSGKAKNIFATVMASLLVGAFLAMLVYALFFHRQSPFNMIFRNKSFDYSVKADLADTYYFAEQFEEARPILEELIEMKPDLARPRAQLGVTFAKLGYPDKAIESLEKAVELDPEYHEAYANLAAIYQAKASGMRDMMDFVKARELLLIAERQIEKALELRSENSNYLEMQKNIISDQGKLPD
ncbi:MAG TPA: tetratricopeptide repeat protein [bacterium]|nr:tetratricopeptide repeat protein [bacterium]